MTPDMALELANKAVLIAIQLSAPLLLSTIVVGVLVNIIQTVTSIRDQTLSFVPKVIAAVVVMGVAMPWAIQTMSSYFEEIFLMFGMFGQHP